MRDLGRHRESSIPSAALPVAAQAEGVVAPRTLFCRAPVRGHRMVAKRARRAASCQEQPRGDSNNDTCNDYDRRHVMLPCFSKVLQVRQIT